MSTSEPETLRPPIAVVAWALAVAAVAVPALCRLPGLPSVESSDRALFELRTRDVFSLDPPLVGAYSRYGWNHPGPVFQYLFAIPYRLFGGDATAIRLTAVLCTVGMMTWIATLLRRRGRIANVGVATAVVGLVAMRGDLLALDTWNPTLAVLPVLVALVAAWMTLERPTAGRLGSVLAAWTLAAQAHSGTAIVLLPAVALAVAVAVRAWWRGGHPRPGRAAAWWAAGLTAAWLPVVVDTLAHWPGNLADVARWALRADEPSAGLREAVGVVGRATSLSWPWQAGDVTFLRTIDVALGVVPFALIALLAAARLLAGRGPLRHAVHVAAAGWLGALLGAAGLRGPRFDYLVGWLYPLVAFSWAVVAMAAAVAIRRRLGGHRPDGNPAGFSAMRRAGAAAGVVTVAAVAMALVIVAVAAVAVGRTLSADHPDVATSAAVATLAAEVPDTGGRTLEVRRLDDEMLSGLVAAGLANVLDARGITLAEPGLANLYGTRRAGRTADVVVGVRAWSAGDALPAGAEELACWGRPSEADGARRARLRTELAALLTDGGRTDLVPLLDTANAAIVLAADPPADVAERADDVRALADLQAHAGRAVCLYLL